MIVLEHRSRNEEKDRAELHAGNHHQMRPERLFILSVTRRGDWFPKLLISGWGHADLSLEGIAKGHFCLVANKLCNLLLFSSEMSVYQKHPPAACKGKGSEGGVDG
jgi:hypothetical protein